MKRPVQLGEEKIGKLLDLVIVDKDVVAEVTHLCVERPFGRPRWFVPWQHVQSLGDRTVILQNVGSPESLEAEPAGAVLLDDYIVDKKVLDVEGREVEIVYDVTLALRNGRLYVVGVDLSKRALLRRIGLRWLAKLTASVTDRIEHDIVAWNFIEPLPEGLGSFAGDIRLRIVREELAKMPPVDVARILEQLDETPRMAIFEALEPEIASDALEELDPKAQREVVAATPKEKVAALINDMTPGQAADVLAALPWADVGPILRLLEPVKGRKVRDILEEQESLVDNYVSTDFVKLRTGSTVGEARHALQAAKARDAVAYLYVVSDQEELVGVIPSTELLLASDETVLKDLIRSTPVTLSLGSTLREASALFSRYGYLALPAIDEQGKMQGIIPSRDIIGLKHHDLG
jgi:CBS domain-containing protein